MSSWSMRIEIVRAEREPGTHRCIVERDDGARVGFEMQGHGARLPHDLSHLAVESALEARDGFWGLLATGAVFSGMKRVGRQGKGGDGRRIIERGRPRLDEVEVLVAAITGAWEQRATTFSIAGAGEADIERCFISLDRWQEAWQAVAGGERLVLEWRRGAPPVVIQPEGEA